MKRREKFLPVIGAAVLSVALATSAGVRAEDGDVFEGVVHAIDGDTLYVDGVRVRIWGLAAAEASTPDGVLALGAMDDIIRNAEDASGVARASCVEMDRDRRKRIVARCLVGGRDVALMMMWLGFGAHYRFYTWAADRPDRHELAWTYDEAERFARKNRFGIWRRFEWPDAEAAMRREAWDADRGVR